MNAGIRGSGLTAEGFADAKVGYHFAPNASVFGFTEASLSPGSALAWQAGVGLEMKF